jgi:hypothetical protein
MRARDLDGERRGSASERPLKTIFYLHIPKTGGQTLALRLASCYPTDKTDIIGPDLIFPRDVAYFQQLVEEKLFIERHSAGPMLGAVSNVDVLTTIRDPIAQIASHYLYVARAPESDLHRAARALSMEAFFASFGDLLANFQTRSLLRAFYKAADRNSVDWARPRTWCNKVNDALDRIRWIVPTESIDDFVALWQLEMRRHVPYSTVVANMAEKDDKYERLLALSRDNSERYFVDLVLWQTAKQRFREYREQVMRVLTPTIGADDASRSYWNGSEGIWLLNGWHPPQSSESLGRHWWAGPDSRSEVAYVRRKDDRFLRFSVGVLCGVIPEDLWATTGDHQRTIPLMFARRNDIWQYCIDLDEQPLEGRIQICVPQVLAPLIVDPESSDARRMSFAAHNWSLTKDLPDDVIRKGNSPVLIGK